MRDGTECSTVSTPCELIFVRYREKAPSWLRRLPLLGVPHTIYTQGDGPMLGVPGVHEELMGTNVGREGYVYLSHLLRHGVRAQQTVFCQMVPQEPKRRLQFLSLGANQSFDLLSSVEELSRKPNLDFMGFTYVWSGIRNLPKHFGMSARDSAYRANGIYRSENSENPLSDAGRTPGVCEYAQWHNKTLGLPVDLDAPFAPGGCFAIDCASARRALTSGVGRRRLEAIRTELSVSSSPLEGFMLERSWPEVFGLFSPRGADSHRKSARSMVRALGCVQTGDAVLLHESNRTQSMCTQGLLSVGRPLKYGQMKYGQIKDPAEKQLKLLDALRSCAPADLNDTTWLARSAEGFCGFTEADTGCQEGSSSGSWTLPAYLWNQGPEGWSRAVFWCLRHCARCDSCRHISVSIQHRDCSWFRECRVLQHNISGLRAYFRSAKFER